MENKRFNFFFHSTYLSRLDLEKMGLGGGKGRGNVKIRIFFSPQKILQKSVKFLSSPNIFLL